MHSLPSSPPATVEASEYFIRSFFDEILIIKVGFDWFALLILHRPAEPTSCTKVDEGCLVDTIKLIQLDSSSYCQ